MSEKAITAFIFGIFINVQRNNMKATHFIKCKAIFVSAYLYRFSSS